MSDLKLYRAKLKTRKQIMAEIPREHQGWWADVCAGETLELRDATEADLERCSLNRDAPRDPAEYLCENIERGSLVRRIAVAELTEITPRGLVAQHNETNALRARIKELEAELALRTQPEATAPSPEQRIADALAELASAQKPLDADVSKIIFDNMWALYGDDFGAKVAPVQDLSAAILALPLPEPEVHDAAGYRRAFTAEQIRDLLKAAAALASSANALSAGDRVDAERYRYLRDHGVPETDAEIEKALTVYQGVGLSSLLPDELDAAIDAAILQTKKGDNE